MYCTILHTKYCMTFQIAVPFMITSVILCCAQNLYLGSQSKASVTEPHLVHSHSTRAASGAVPALAGLVDRLSQRRTLETSLKDNKNMYCLHVVWNRNSNVLRIIRPWNKTELAHSWGFSEWFLVWNEKVLVFTGFVVVV